MNKYIIYSTAVLTAFLFFINPNLVNAAISLSLSPQSQGPTGIELTIKGEDFCIHNIGFPVTVMWDGAPIDVGIAPSFEIKYIIPSDATEESHTILAIASCAGQPPAIPSSVDQATTTYTVVADNEDIPTSNNTDDKLDTTSKEDKETATIIVDNENKDEKENDKNTFAPWYLNWIYLSLMCLGLVILVVGIILLVKYKKNKSSKLDSKPGNSQLSKNTEIISKPKSKKILKTSILKKPQEDNSVKSRVEYEE